ncbi:unnamed protein product [Medioppia subpectinata]|uniref:Uncharacterized protein n=1 Tax=Medioppia subpectinata TaxID=1979941 RepID=A0A7R9KCI8_9ACAR|nr:unnamed protein product [Medioppia subpectinata]CAG2100595.1 unnamed protein product [Medioppia subpectinata]
MQMVTDKPPTPAPTVAITYPTSPTPCDPVLNPGITCDTISTTTVSTPVPTNESVAVVTHKDKPTSGAPKTTKVPKNTAKTKEEENEEILAVLLVYTFYNLYVSDDTKDKTVAEEQVIGSNEVMETPEEKSESDGISPMRSESDPNVSQKDPNVYIGCRDQTRGEAAVKDILALNPKANISLLLLDLSSLKSVRKCVEELSGLETKVDILINNAGVRCPELQTVDGFEMQIGTNHLGHFLFTLHLIPLLKKAPASRIVTVASALHNFGQIDLQNINLRNGAYHPFFSYAQSKLANVLFSRELAKRLRHSNINTYSLDPGVVNTDLNRHFDKSAPWEGTGMVAYEFGTNVMNMRRKCKSERRLDGKVVVITGANTGIGKETALQLSLRGAKIYIGCRSLEKAESAIDDMKGVNPSADITALKLDLSSFKSVRQFADKLKARESAVDKLINNAGIYNCPEWQTADGFEMQFGTNHLGPFLLTQTLLPMLKAAPVARIVNVTSMRYALGMIHFDNINLRNGAYDPNAAYDQSKLAVLLCTRELAKRMGADSSVTCYAVNPGAIKTDLQRHSNYPESVMNALFMTPEMGAQTTLYCALEETLDNESGFYYELGTESNVKCYALNPGVIKTDLQRHQNYSQTMMNMMFLTPEMGAQTTLYCALDEKLDNESGFYYDNCKREHCVVKQAKDDKVAEQLWDLSCGLVELGDEYRI